MGTLPLKKAANADAGDADHIGGNDWDDLADALNDVDKTGPIKMNTAWWFRDDKLNFRDSGNDHLYNHSFANLAANRIVNWPLLPTDDTVAFNDMAATFKNKTLDSSCTISGAVANRTYTTILYKDGSTYYAIKYDGTVVSSGSTAETVIQAALDVKGVVYFADNGAEFTDWVLSGAFAGFTVDSGTYIISDTDIRRVRIFVPNAFAGICFKFIGTSGALDQNVRINGLSLDEDGTPAKNWTGIKFEIAGTDTLSYNTFEHIKVQNAGTAIELEVSNSRWIESNTFRNITLMSCRIGMLFDLQSGAIHRNLFEKVVVQGNSEATATYGFKDIDGTNNLFIGCDCWDFTTANIEANIKSTAINTMIIGGLMTGEIGHFINAGTKTLVLQPGEKNAQNTILTTPDLAKYGTWYGLTATNGNGILDGILQAIAVGTGADAGKGLDATGVYRTYDTAATINSITGLRSNSTFCTRIGNAYFKTAIYLNSVSNVRVYAGFISSGSAPTSLADPLANLSGIGLWFDSVVAATFKIGHNDGDATGDYDATGVTANIATLYPVEIYAQNDARWRFVFNGVSTDITTEMPASTTGLCFWVYMENTTGASRTMRHYYVTVRNDK